MDSFVILFVDDHLQTNTITNNKYTYLFSQKIYELKILFNNRFSIIQQHLNYESCLFL